MDRAHFKNTSSTLSPVSADVSKNIKSEESKANEVSKRETKEREGQQCSGGVDEAVGEGGAYCSPERIGTPR
jgi:hypothetical protein